ncbi:MAG: YdcF family protein [Eggerthellales bacterium]|nr:YdcF family protein [Eggerthellales bacterium]
MKRVRPIRALGTALLAAIVAAALLFGGVNLGETLVAKAHSRDLDEALMAASGGRDLLQVGLPGAYEQGETHSSGLFSAGESGYPYDCIVVLGASVLPDGSPSDILRSRLDAGIVLYFAGYAPIIVMSGNGAESDYDEPGNMKAYAIAQGVPESAIFCDDGGLHTYDTMWRMAHVFGAEHVVVVSQEYHLHRCVCDALGVGLEVLGVASDSSVYNDQFYYELRECGARVHDLFQVATGATPPDPDSEIEP